MMANPRSSDDPVQRVVEYRFECDACLHQFSVTLDRSGEFPVLHTQSVGGLYCPACGSVEGRVIDQRSVSATPNSCDQ